MWNLNLSLTRSQRSYITPELWIEHFKAFWPRIDVIQQSQITFRDIFCLKYIRDRMYIHFNSTNSDVEWSNKLFLIC